MNHYWQAHTVCFSMIVTWLRNSVDHICVTGGLCHVLRSLTLWGRSGGNCWSVLTPLDGELCCCYTCPWWGTGRDRDPRKSGEGAVAYLMVHCHHQNESALRWAAALVVITCLWLWGAKVTRHNVEEEGELRWNQTTICIPALCLIARPDPRMSQH